LALQDRWLCDKGLSHVPLFRYLMYSNIRTNLPKEVMAFPGYAFPSELPSFIRHQEVLEYLQNYAQHYNLAKYIKVGIIRTWLIKVWYNEHKCCFDHCINNTVFKQNTSIHLSHSYRNAHQFLVKICHNFVKGFSILIKGLNLGIIPPLQSYSKHESWLPHALLIR